LSVGVNKIEFLKLHEITELTNHLVLKQIISNKDFNGSLSLTWVKIDGQHQPLRTHSQLRVYIIISGSFSFQIENRRTHQLEKHDVLTLEAGTSYSLFGKGEYIVLNAPAFKDGDDEYLDD
jgi:mannose-6-phosphate isomerase-like protein (cupin superfamily)